MSPKAPCRNCEKRSIGCHGKCDDYLVFKEETERLRELKRADFINTYHGSRPWLSATLLKRSYKYNP